MIREIVIDTSSSGVGIREYVNWQEGGRARGEETGKSGRERAMEGGRKRATTRYNTSSVTLSDPLPYERRRESAGMACRASLTSAMPGGPSPSPPVGATTTPTISRNANHYLSLSEVRLTYLSLSYLSSHLPRGTAPLPPPRQPRHQEGGPREGCR